MQEIRKGLQATPRWRHLHLQFRAGFEHHSQNPGRLMQGGPSIGKCIHSCSSQRSTQHGCRLATHPWFNSEARWQESDTLSFPCLYYKPKKLGVLWPSDPKVWKEKKCQWEDIKKGVAMLISWLLEAKQASNRKITHHRTPFP
jgi:hypothetical protein